MSHSAKDFFGKRANQKTIKDGLGGPMGRRSEAVKQYKKSEIKQKKDIKALNKKIKNLFSISKKYGSRRELKMIKKTRATDSKKRYNSISNSPSDESDSDSSLSSDSD